MCPKKDGVLVVDMNDEVVRGATVVKDGAITWPPPAPKLSAAPGARAGEAANRRRSHVGEDRRARRARSSALLVGARSRSSGLGMVAPPSFMAHFTVFVLACFVGYMVVWNVTPALHTPLMSVTNAISSIIIIGALLQVSTSQTGRDLDRGHHRSCSPASTSPAASPSRGACSRCSGSRERAMTAGLVIVSYIGATILFILALGGLSNQETARRGNLFGIIGMAHRARRDDPRRRHGQLRGARRRVRRRRRDRARRSHGASR